jgi:hypothetical protein
VWPPAALEFLRELEDNNDRAWFKVNRPRYDQDLLAPARALAEKLSDLGAPHFFRPYRDTRLLVSGGGCQADVCPGWIAEWSGGAWARRSDGCARAPRLTSVREQGWFLFGDMMVDGVTPRMVLRPLVLSRPFPGVGRQRVLGSWPRFIG